MNTTIYPVNSTLTVLFRENDAKLKNTTVSHLFLDKVVKVIDGKHPDHQELNSFGYGSSLYASITVIDLLGKILHRLNTDEQILVEAWIEDEKKYLSFVDKVDTWRSTPEMLKLFHKAHVERSDIPLIKIDHMKIDQMATELAEATARLDPGTALKMIGGDSVHETRIIVRKKGSKYQLTYLDTNKKFEYRLNAPGFDKEFWKAVINQKLSPDKFDCSFFSQFGVRMILEGPSVKSVQQTRSCSAQSVLADLKNHIAQQHTIPFYKELKKLMIQEVLATDSENLNPTVLKYLEFRSSIIGLSSKTKEEKRSQIQAKLLSAETFEKKDKISPV